MINVLFIGGVYSENLIKDIKKNCKHGYQYAAQALQESLIQGFEDNNVRVKVLAFPSVPTFPIGYKSCILKTSSFYYKGKHLGKSVGRLNFPVFRINFSYKREIKEWIDTTTGDKIVFVYSLNMRFLRLARKLKQEYPEIQICVMVPDLLEYVSVNPIYEFLGLRKREKRLVNEYLASVDFYVLLSEYMKEKLPIDHANYVIVEGIFNYTNEISSNCPFSTNNKNVDKIILYTGNIDRRYGIIDLLDAFSLIDNPDYRLWICGFGDTETEILQRVQNDVRISYFGSLTREKVLELQKKATVLVNPRHSHEEYVKYSFPSKTMEYLASGTPTIMCKLCSIPSDYNKFIYFFSDESNEGYANTIKQICNQDEDVLLAFGKSASQFIIKNKNPKCQVGKILSMFAGHYSL